MIARLIALASTAVLAVVCHAAPVDANTATLAELEAVAAIGPAIAQAIIDERRRGAFKDWQQLIHRVKGIGTHNAARLSAEGLTVDGASYRGPAAARGKKDEAAP